MQTECKTVKHKRDNFLDCWVKVALKISCWEGNIPTTVFKTCLKHILVIWWYMLGTWTGRESSHSSHTHISLCISTKSTVPHCPLFLFLNNSILFGTTRLSIEGWMYVPICKLGLKSAVMFPQPLVIQVKHPVSGLNQFPISRTKNPERIVPVFPDPVQLNRFLPFDRQVFIWKRTK